MFSNSLIAGAAGSQGGGFYPTTIDQSLRFEDGDGAYLTRTPSSAGSLTTWTYSAWIKLGNLGIHRSLLVGNNGLADTTFTEIRIDNGDNLLVNGWNTIWRKTSAKFRDPDAWYHIVVAFDTTEASESNRIKIWINGDQVTAFDTNNTVGSNNGGINTTGTHYISTYDGTNYDLDGYLAEIHFTDGTAYDADDFGELKSGIWIPKEVSVTYGTNGFYLPFTEDVTVEGFNTVTYTGKGGTRTVKGVGFEPDLVWIKNRSGVYDHHLYDSIRGAGERLQPNTTNAEATVTTGLTSFDSEGFTLGSDGAVNLNTNKYVAWCWDAGSGSPVSNTDGSITSSVKANTAYGFSIVSWTATGSVSTTGHGLNSAPEIVITKPRTGTYDWAVLTDIVSGSQMQYLYLNTTAAIANTGWGTNPTNSVMSTYSYSSGVPVISYCFHSVSGYSDFGTYTGNGQADDNGPTVTTGFKPALVIYKQSSGTGNWSMVDNTRSPEPVADNLLNPNLSNAENTSDEWIKFTDTGFQVRNTHSDQNANGATYIYMAFADTRDAAFWLDQSGNDNDWTHNNLENSDIVPDSPTNNLAVLNPVSKNGSEPAGTKEGNTHFIITSGSNYCSLATTVGSSSGKWYCEGVIKSSSALASARTGGGVLRFDDPRNNYIGAAATGWAYGSNGTLYNLGNNVTGAASLAVNDVFMLAVDLDAGKMWVGKNGTWESSGDPAAGTGEQFSNLTGAGEYFFGAWGYTTSDITAMNFGQDSTFAGLKTAGGNSDANGIGDFQYAPPSGYLALCTSNLPDPAEIVDPNLEGTSDQHFNVYTYTGNGATQLVGDVVREIPDTYPISQSLRFEDGDNAYLTRTPSSAGSLTTWTYSAWVKLGNLDTHKSLLVGNNGLADTTFTEIRIDNGNNLLVNGWNTIWRKTSFKFSDPSAWYHIAVAFDTTESTEADRIKIWINGVLVSAFDTNNTVGSNNGGINTTGTHYISTYDGTNFDFDGYLAEVHFIDGTAYDADTFGVFDADGLWRPIEPTVTYGTNGFHLPFSGGSDFSGFFDGTGDYLSFSNAVFDFGTSEDYSVEMFVKFNNVPSTIGFAGGYANSTFTLNYSSGNLTVGKHFVGTQLTASTSFSVGQWYHIVACRESGTLSLFVDGTRLATTSDSTGYTATAGNIGTDGFYAAVNGYISNARVLTGASAYDPTSTSLTVPTAALTAIANTELLTCQNGTFVDNSTNDYTITANGNAVTAKVAPFALDYTDDHSGEGNTWTFNNIVPSDVVSDSPTNSFATISSVDRNSSLRSYEGNLATSNSTTAWRSGRATIAVRSGKWYWEVVSEYAGATDERGIYGVANEQLDNTDYLSDAQTANSIGATQVNGTTVRFYGTNSLADQSDTTLVSGSDVFNFAFDADNGDLYCGRNGVWYNSGDPAAGTGATNTSLDVSQGMAPAYSHYGSASDTTGYWNFGQDSTFAGNKTAGGNPDANGIGDFKYAPPSGYLALCTANLPDPVIDPAQDATADQNFNVYTYVGNGGTQLIGDVVREIPDTYPISQSLRFEDGDSAYLSRTPASAGNLKTWTWSAWVKRGNIGSTMTLFGTGVADNGTYIHFISDDRFEFAHNDVGTYSIRKQTSAVFSDPSAWYHLVVTLDTTDATAEDRAKIWVNGERVTNWQSDTDPSLNKEVDLNTANAHNIGRLSTSRYFDGYMAEVHFIDGTAYDADTFGVFDADGLWRPIDPSVTYGTNGFHLDFADSADIGDDNSGNTNDWTPNNLAATDVVIDAPTNNFAVLDDLSAPTADLSEGSLKITRSTNYGGATATFAIPKSGKWYWENWVFSGANTDIATVGICNTSFNLGGTPATGNWYGLLAQSGAGDLTDIYADGKQTDLTVGLSAGDILQVAVNADDNEIYLGINNTWYAADAGTDGNPSTGANPSIASYPDEDLFPFVNAYDQQIIANFGQDTTFAGNESAQSNADANGFGEFQYAPPTGFLALCENNLIQYDDNPLERPDLVWLKRRDGTGHNGLWDSIRGEGSALLTNSANAENANDAGYDLTGFSKNGFTVGPNNVGDFNTSGGSYVGWAWKAGGTGVSNTDGTITSTVSANTDAGFSIVGYTGTKVSGETIGHGLSQTPEMIIVKNRNSSLGWRVYHQYVASDPETDNLELNSTNAAADASTIWNDTAPTSSVFTVGNSSYVNNTNNHIAYCFHSVDGFSKVGSYIGNGNADGPFVYTGFRPKWVMIKVSSSSGQNWVIYDSERNAYNVMGKQLYPNLSNAEADGGTTTTNAILDFTSNGFKLRGSHSSTNYSTRTIVYLAFAEQPFKYSNAR